MSDFLNYVCPVWVFFFFFFQFNFNFFSLLDQLLLSCIERASVVSRIGGTIRASCVHGFYYLFSKITFKVDYEFGHLEDFNLLFLSFKEVCNYVIFSF